MAQPKRIHPFLWFDGQAGQAADFYLGLFRNSRLLRTQRWAMDTPGAKKGDVLAVDFELEGERFTALNGGPNFQFTPAVSFLVDCDDQAEIDRLWDGLLSGGGLVALASLPLLAFGAPFIILRNTVRGRRLEGRPIPFVMLATILACGWGLVSGRVVLDLAHLVSGA